ncbi:MAG: type II toxin-antitoxin system VapC family toxin [Chthoniobacterales bacterium]
MAAVEHLLDAGPLVALIDAGDRDHDWSRKALGRLRPPLITCEAALSEALFLLRNDRKAPEKIAKLFQRGLIASVPVLDTDADAVLDLMSTYANVPMSLADACLVRLSEKIPSSTVVTLDSDFTIYRKSRNKKIPLLAPPRTKRG